MSKKIELIRNGAGGVDLITERDAGNEVRILTGKMENSRDFWTRMRQAAWDALNEMDADEHADEVEKLQENT